MPWLPAGAPAMTFPHSCSASEEVRVPTAMQWTNRLLDQIEKQKRYAAPYELRYRGQFVLPFLLQEYREVYGARVDHFYEQLHPPKTGAAAIGVDALVERLTVSGAISADPAAVQLVQEAWQDNDLDVMHREAHREALIKSRSFASAHRDSTGSKAIVGIEAPEQMAVHRQQAPPYDVDAALKISVDEWTGKRAGQLRLPGLDIPLVEGDSPVNDPDGSDVVSRWVPSGAPVQTRLLGVPVVEFANRPRLLKQPQSDIEQVATLVDIADLVEGLMVFAGHFGAVPIRYATGLPVPRDPADPNKPLLGPNGQPMVGFQPRADHFWSSTSADTKFGQLTPATLDTFVTWANHVAGLIRAKTSIASTYYSLDLKSHMSAELLKTDEAPMVRRVLAMGRDGAFGQSWRRLQQLILMIEAPASQARVAPRWADPETRVEAQATDSFMKVVAGGIGPQVAAEKILGWDPELVARGVKEAQDAEAARAAADPAVERIANRLLGDQGASAGD